MPKSAWIFLGQQNPPLKNSPKSHQEYVWANKNSPSNQRKVSRLTPGERSTGCGAPKPERSGKTGSLEGGLSCIGLGWVGMGWDGWDG